MFNLRVVGTLDDSPAVLWGEIGREVDKDVCRIKEPSKALRQGHGRHGKLGRS